MLWSEQDERQWRELEAKRMLAQEAKHEKLNAFFARHLRLGPVCSKGEIHKALTDNADDLIAALQPFSKNQAEGA